MSMNAGRLVWSRMQDKSWESHSIDEQFIYTATQEQHLWKVEYRKYVPHFGYQLPVQIGSPTSTLKLAKRLADEHHHMWIRKHGALVHHDYILRFPLGELK